MKNAFVEKIFNENKNIFEQHMKETGCNEETAKKELVIILSNLDFALHLENKKGPFKLKEVQNCLSVKLGYYKVMDTENKNPEMYCEQTTLTQTEKGFRILNEYKKISA